MNTSLKLGVVKREVAIVSVGELTENPMPSGGGWRERRNEEPVVKMASVRVNFRVCQ